MQMMACLPEDLTGDLLLRFLRVTDIGRLFCVSKNLRIPQILQRMCVIPQQFTLRTPPTFFGSAKVNLDLKWCQKLNMYLSSCRINSKSHFSTVEENWSKEFCGRLSSLTIVGLTNEICSEVIPWCARLKHISVCARSV